MQLYLHGGLNSGIKSEVDYYYSLLKQIIQEQNPRQVLHLPFARTGIYTKVRESTQPMMMKPFIQALGIEYLDAKYMEDCEKADHPMILMTGGNDNANLYNQIIKHDFLYRLVMNASCIFGDSAGIIVCSKAVFYGSDRTDIFPGLGLFDSVAIPHFTQQGLDELKAKDIMREIGANSCFAIDENAVVKTTSENISDYTIFGKGNAQLITL